MNTGHRLLPTLQSPGKHDIEFSGAELHLAKSVDLFSDTQERVTISVAYFCDSVDRKEIK